MFERPRLSPVDNVTNLRSIVAIMATTLMVALSACSNGPAPRPAAAPFLEANYCPDDATLQTLRATQVGGGVMVKRNLILIPA